MAVANDILIIINSGPDKRYNHYEAYTVAWVARKYYKAKKVTIMYGPQAVEMTKKGTLAGYTMTPEVKRLTASQFEGLKAEKLPDHLEQLARFEQEDSPFLFKKREGRVTERKWLLKEQRRII